MRRRVFGDAVVGEGSPLKRKLQAKPVVADNVEGDALPLSLLMKKDWCTGKLSSKRIQEYCAGRHQRRFQFQRSAENEPYRSWSQVFPRMHNAI